MVPFLFTTTNIAIVNFDSNRAPRILLSRQLLFDLLDILQHIGTLRIISVNGKNDNLRGCQARRNDKTIVIAVAHDQRAHEPR